MDIEHAADIIRSGGLVAFPTETVYGLGANALSEEAVRSVYEAKGRPSDNPMIVHIAKMEDMDSLVEGGSIRISPYAKQLARKLWPGPLTMVFPKSENVPSVTTGGLDTVAIRMPFSQVARDLIEAAELPIAAPSANLSGKPSPTTADDVLEDMDGKIDAVIMGEQCDVGIESTVLDVTGDVPVILRPGIVTKEWLESVLGCEVRYDKSLLEGRPDEEGFKPMSPGMKYTHYSPNAKVRIIEGDDDTFRTKAMELGVEAMREGLRPAVLEYGKDAKKAAHKLFADLRELDRQGYDLILLRALDREGEGFSVMNRMLKSAGYDVVK